MNFIYTRSAKRVPETKCEAATSFLYGKHFALCRRSSYLNNAFLNENDIPLYPIEYSPEDQAILLDTENIYANTSTFSLFGDFPAVNLSSIDVGEMWILLRMLAKGIFQKIEFYYLVPDSYGQSGVGKLIRRKQISISGGRWHGLPGLLTAWNIDAIDFRQLSFLGFDVHRLGSIESYEGFPDNLNRTFILADPPTAPYWLERSLRDNYDLIEGVMRDNNTDQPIDRVPGMCPSTVNSYLREIKKLAPANQRWCLLPLGPKIQTLGAIIFVSNQLEMDNNAGVEPTVGVLYDFPKPNAEITTTVNSTNYYWSFSVERV